LVQLGVRAIPVGIAAFFLTLVLKSPGTQADPADTGSARSGISVFGTIHPELFRLRSPLGSERSAGRVQLASLDPQVGFDAAANRFEPSMDTSASACWNALLDERFVPFDHRPASFWAEDCPMSFDERFRSAMPAVASGLRSPADRDVQNHRADAPKPVVSRAIVSSARPSAGQARKEVALPGDDGHTAIYDITAHTVYLPSGRRLEAHSGLGGIMDNPSHAHRKMRGPTPPNIYNLTLRERIFHGVRAIRLNPVDEGRMHGRDGILAHSYMLGQNGQSNGCVAFRNYPEFLDAFRKGEVTRLAVVDRLQSPPGKLAAGQLPEPVRELMKATERSRQYAAAGDR
jgi:Tlde1 domain